MNHKDDPDAQLMLAFQNGDESAFSDIFARHRARVLNVAFHFVGDRDSAQDVAQDVFVKIYASPKSYRPDAAFSTWLYRVTANACMDEMRKRKRSRSVSADHLSELPADPAATPEAQAASSELERQVRAAVASLPEKQRLAIILQRYEGLSYQQVAVVMKTSVASVESLLFRAKQSLRDRLASYVEDGSVSAEEKS